MKAQTQKTIIEIIIRQNQLIKYLISVIRDIDKLVDTRWKTESGNRTSIKLVLFQALMEIDKETSWIEEKLMVINEEEKIE